ncbi:DUF423 domain-containing protein [Paenibacillus dendritiformis]|uniref:DUF423 domain-containing protein n=1 Tax=Paenibacillus dendritiformis C454 TaxID=1131935 RepID=H3SAE8_9BACL|nr:DUF423 domain-containing protein [Paenibacillus dendritiformis]EHQ63951.1 hypothetical protein PDENDC454_02405 [Paenibacillus dendritiformis C454]PZM65615.1 DUF423 domain-containing protein [Paenibacillus dendritiformis]CAH8772275.1 DUF423 domain-containing protein [Paenibacillus dendritiformis]
MLRRYAIIGSLNMLLSVALGAFGAHIMQARLTPERMATYETAVQYHMAHALGLILIAILADKLADQKKVQWSARLLLTGMIIFSGSLYLLCFTGFSMLGAITPIGGVAFLIGWLMLALAARR